MVDRGNDGVGDGRPVMTMAMSMSILMSMITDTQRDSSPSR